MLRDAPDGNYRFLPGIAPYSGGVASAPGFEQQPAVVDGASHVLHAVFGDAGRHTRSAIGVAALPRGGAVEIEVIAAVSRHKSLGQ